MSAPRIGYVIVAAGIGTRLGAPEPKAFTAVRGEPMIAHTLRTVAALPHSAVVVVAPTDRHEQVAACAAELSFGVATVAGGDSRHASVVAGLAALSEHAPIDVVLVHDAARPFTPAEVFLRVIDSVVETGDGAIPALPVVDTVKTVDSGIVTGSPDRSTLRAVQTPQGFPLDALVAAAAAVDSKREYTDDASVFAAHGGRVRVVEGDPRARKITTPDDLEWANGGAERVGTGIDAHAFSSSPEAELWLAGLLWPGEPGLDGHSDGDVACHALVDAILGAAGLGDIGGMFGTDDPQFAGARGDVFLREALARVSAAGWQVRNATVEIVGNRPKLAPRRAEAEARLTELLGAPVNLAATTTDGLGLTGEGRGIGAIASVLLARP